MIVVWILSYFAVFMLGSFVTFICFDNVAKSVEKAIKIERPPCSEDCVCNTLPILKSIKDPNKF